MEQIIDYIKRKYNPLSIIIYGSYANGTNDTESDFDALVICSDCEQYHDTSYVKNVRLDVFVYPEAFFAKGCELDNFVQIIDGKIIVDTEEKGRKLLKNVQAHFRNRPNRSRAENQSNVDWCVKMLERAKREDAEGKFRWHWVLTESLEIFCDINDHPYMGAKKSLKWMKDEYPFAFACYKKALEDFSIDSLEAWILYITKIWNG